jgi:maleylacetate reductase
VTAAKQQLIAEAMGRPGRPAADAVAELIAAVGQPTTLRAVGVRREQLAKIAEMAMHYPWVRTNPRPIRSPAEVMQILEAAW